MQQKTPIFILIGIIVIVGFVWMMNSKSDVMVVDETTTPANPNETTPTATETDDTEMAASEEMVDEEEIATTADTETQSIPVLEAVEPTALVAGTYDVYSPEAVANAEGDIVLFFKADWCPSCRALDADIRANAVNIPAGVTILEADYDSQTALRQQYGVTTQHTMVQIDSDGAQIKKWSGTPRLENLLNELI